MASTALTQLVMLLHRFGDIPGAGQSGGEMDQVPGSELNCFSVRGGHFHPPFQQIAGLVGITVPIKPRGFLFPNGHSYTPCRSNSWPTGLFAWILMDSLFLFGYELSRFTNSATRCPSFRPFSSAAPSGAPTHAVPQCPVAERGSPTTIMP
jgi:hypothetical protein